jgi:hypothetical protein
MRTLGKEEISERLRISLDISSVWNTSSVDMSKF